MTITASKPNTPETCLIYESPDGGKTVYARQLGSDERYLVSKDPALIEREKTAVRANRLLSILRMSETDCTIKDALEKLEALYILKYGHETND